MLFLVRCNLVVYNGIMIRTSRNRQGVGRVKLSETVTIELRKAIARGEYRPGQRLTEAALCERFKVSRTPIREALRELEAEGLVTVTSNLGASVVKLTPENMNNIYDMLIVLEGTACSMAATRMSEEDIVRLEDCHFRITQAATEKNYDLVFELNRRFHVIIVESTANPYLIQMRRLMSQLSNRFGRLTLTPMVPGQMVATLEEHPEVIAAIRKRNPGMAEFQGRRHMESAKKFTLKYFQKIGELP